MPLESPFDVDPPGSVRVSSGALGAAVLADGSTAGRARITWPAPARVNTAEGGRAQAEWRRYSGNVPGPWLAAELEAPLQTFVFVAPVYDGEEVQARVRFINASGRPGAWTESERHVVTHPIVGKLAASFFSRGTGWRGTTFGANTAGEEVQAAAYEPFTPTGSVAYYLSKQDGWRGATVSADQVAPTFSTVARTNSMTQGFDAAALNAAPEPQIGNGSVSTYESLRQGWRGPIVGAHLDNP